MGQENIREKMKKQAYESILPGHNYSTTPPPFELSLITFVRRINIYDADNTKPHERSINILPHPHPPPIIIPRNLPPAPRERHITRIRTHDLLVIQIPHRCRAIARRYRPRGGGCESCACSPCTSWWSRGCCFRARRRRSRREEPAPDRCDPWRCLRPGQRREAWVQIHRVERIVNHHD